ncbi:MAG TPA: glycosyltransferase family 39 protein [Vicinamibacterales bacterium]|nr:glycosyltransferase family 39 protein [Vicinamibacterales bacterium]
MVEPAAGSVRWRWAWRAAVAMVVLYAALLRLTILFDRYGPFDHPRWVVALERTTDVIRPALVPAWWAVPKVDQPYVGGDPVNYLKFARELPHFYAATIREPVFLEATRVFLKLTGGQDIAVSFASLTFSVICVLATYLLGRLAVSPPVGLVAAAALAIEQEFDLWAPDGWRDETFAAFVVLTAWALLRLDRRRDWRAAVVLGLVSAGACLTRITSLSFVVPGLLWAAWPRDRVVWRRTLGLTAAAAAVTAVLLVPYLINCRVKTGDALIAINYHTRFYQAAEGTLTAAPVTAREYIAAKFRTHPIDFTDTSVRGLVVYPFTNKWRGFGNWSLYGGQILEGLAVVGLLIWIWQPTGRLLLLVLLTSLVPYMVTWPDRGGSEWRFTMHAYPFYLIAAFGAVAWAVNGVRALAADRSATLAAWRKTRLPAKVAATTALVAAAWVAGYWSPYFVAREALLRGEDTSFAAGDNDGVFFGAGWSPLVQTGAVLARFAETDHVTLRIPIPERRAYRLVLRMDPVPADGAPPQRVRVFLDQRLVGTFDLEWNPQRVGAYVANLDPGAISPGRARLDLMADHVDALGSAQPLFPDLPESLRAAFRLWYVRLSPL